MKSKNVVRALLCSLVIALCMPSMIAVASASVSSEELNVSTSTTQKAGSKSVTPKEASSSQSDDDFEVAMFVVFGALAGIAAIGGAVAVLAGGGQSHLQVKYDNKADTRAQTTTHGFPCFLLLYILSACHISLYKYNSCTDES